MRQYIDVNEAEHLIAWAVEQAPGSTEEKVEAAMNLLMSRAVDLHTVARREGFYCREIADAEHASEC